MVTEPGWRLPVDRKLLKEEEQQEESVLQFNAFQRQTPQFKKRFQMGSRRQKIGNSVFKTIY